MSNFDTMKRDQTYFNDATSNAGDKSSVQDTPYAQSRLSDLHKDDSRLLQLFDLKALPPMVILAFIFGIETAAFSHAVIFGLSEDLGPSHSHLSWLYAAPHVLPIALYFPVAWVISDGFPLDMFASFAFCICGSLLSFMADAGSTAVMVGRLLQGLLEAGILPMLVSRTQILWCREEVPLRMSFWCSMTGLATIVMSIFTYLLVSSPYKGPYSVLILNCTAVLFYMYMLWHITLSLASSMELKFLGDREQKIAYGVKRLSVPRNGGWCQQQVLDTKKDIKTWLWFGLVFFASVPIGGINRLSPLILKSLGVGSSRILFNLPFGIVQILAIVGGGLAATKYRIGNVIIALSLVSFAGFVVLASALHTPATRRESVFAGYYLIPTIYGVVPLIYSWSGMNTGGVTKQKASVAFLFIGQSLGNIFGPLLFTPSSGGVLGCLGLWTIAAVYFFIVGLVVATSMRIRNLNAGHTRRYDTYGTETAASLRSDARLGSALDIELMQSPEGVYMLDDEDNHLPYLFKSQIYEDLTDLEDEGFLFTL